jgi:hypothetical protein
VVIGAGSVLWRRASGGERVDLRRRLQAGAAAGLLATAAYDLVRLAAVRLGSLRLWPFDACSLFG